MTVYVIQEVTGRNIASARQYGDFEVLLPSNTNIMLLLIGDPAAIGVACSIAALFNRGRYNILKWDRQEGMYYPVFIDLNQKGEI